ncbi:MULTISPECIES: Crp/Fnr family transcriptional regulator [unclassified Paenibacillus]|uniref:Crp/Fnr family transcriptional regulator n=1 Tax=unclassified Paenibacillus TaxID=185978 RepID=UPI002406A7DF|nr:MULTISPECIES: Crp/Fnr family transcriptional regulator [unclassified Paenibacillus]MDF9839958.1 CRP-like cAMP-binding protein [Paenibacillus sp. PastF-2]MDF9846540.1 CRP-like cAMP-binding protein [Paenibacillus sp. PastM-2]MDF9853112.1 CRP-like cAMP-binding protein [Paenibacillus sp. PastF-1]MDH6478384.1 CRP-like cAMP-binding protein [Paenibacillus sp. PastH-2]MDH6506118.1 CRP-like cAMP-binding protein [Paenibacillus sp. PastM-3]
MIPDPAVLQSCLLFRGKSAEELELLLHKMIYTVTAYQKNMLIFAEGDTADRIGIILSGRVEVQKTHPTGSSVTIAHLSAGQTIGEAVLFRKENLVPATVTATGPCLVMFISKHELLRLFSADTDILTRFIENLSERLVLVNRKIEILSAGPLRRRMIYFLLEQAVQQASDHIRLPFSRKEWAEHLNTARPSLSREMGNLRDIGWIEFKGSRITLLNREAMHEYIRTDQPSAGQDK